ncbi:TetR family transcriptional regulator [Sphingomonas sp. MMS24-JH45]
MTATAKPTSAPRRRSTKAEQRAEMMEQILDEAESLSPAGLHGVTLKDVAKRIGVHHTLMNYYFADKKALFDAVFARRAVVTSERRMQALNDYAAACGGKPASRARSTPSSTPISTSISRAGRGGRVRRAGRARRQHARMGRGADRQHFDPVVLRLIDLLKQALPVRRRTSTGATISSPAR